MYAVNVTTEQQEPHLRQGKGSSGAAARAHISQTRVLSNTRCPWQIRKRKLLLERTDPADWKTQACHQTSPNSVMSGGGGDESLNIGT
jgi:hypothetical protein